MSRFLDAFTQYFDSSGNVLEEGLLFFYESGTNTPKSTFKDVNETTPNTHPVKLTGGGRVPDIFYTGSAKVVLHDKNNVQIDEADPVTGTNSSGALGTDWDAITSFNKENVVRFNSVLYSSLINNNQNNNPASTPTAWSRFDLLVRWNTEEEYGQGDPVIRNGILYTSNTAANKGNDPALDAVSWKSLINSSQTITGTWIFDESLTIASNILTVDATGLGTNANVILMRDGATVQHFLGATQWMLQTDDTVGGGLKTAISVTINGDTALYSNDVERIKAGSAGAEISGNIVATSAGTSNSSDLVTTDDMARWVINSDGDLTLSQRDDAGVFEQNWAIFKKDGPLNLPLDTFADDTAAGSGGLEVNDLYKTATGEVRIKLV